MGKTKASAKTASSLLELESLIRAGDFISVNKAILSLNRNKIPRAELVQYANIANRVNQGKAAHRFLQAVIRSEKKSETPATDNEKIEYAEALRNMGLIEEAKDVLGEIDPKAQPLADLRFAFCLMTQWKYAEAIPHLKSYIASLDPKDYAHKIAQVNLAAALIIEREDSEALSLLENLRKETKEAGHHLLYGNCLELLAQLFVRQGRLDLADPILKEADLSFTETKSRYSLYMRKWKAISKSLQENKVHPELVECREISIHEGDWETLRECDLYMAHLRKDQDLLNQVYFGTPYPSYRKRVVGLAGSDFLKAETYVWNPNRPEPVTEVFDLLQGKLDSSAENLESGRLMHRFLILLASDFYRPLSIASAFSELFPDEHFTQAGSTNRVSQVVKRLRAWAEEQGSFFSIEENEGNYSLKVRPGTGIRVPAEKPEASSHSVVWNKLLNSELPELFHKSDVIRLLDCSASSANRLLRWSLSSGVSEAIGAGPQRKYRLKSGRKV